MPKPIETLAGADAEAFEDALTPFLGGYAKAAELAATGGSGLVGHSSGHAGGQIRTVQGKLREAVSVLDFMTAAQRTAVLLRNGAEDVTAAIQAAINAVLTPNGGALYFPDGLYPISAKLVIPFSVGWRIYGQSRNGVLIRQATNNTRIFSLETDLTHSWEISELSFEWATQQTTADTQSIAIFMGTGTATGNGFFNFQVRRCFFQKGFRAIASDVANSPAVWGCKISENTLAGTMLGALFQANPTPSVGQPNITVTNNFIDATSLTEPGIRMASGDNVEVSRNEFVGGAATANTSMLVEIGGTTRVQFIGNKSEAYAFGGFSPNLFNFPQSHVVAIGNSFNGFTGTANPKLMSAGTGGSLSIIGLTVSSSMTAGNALPYAADSMPFVVGVQLFGSFVTDNLRQILGNVSVPRFNADRRQMDAVASVTDANVTLTASSDRIQYCVTTLTQNRTITLPNTGLYEGMEFLVVRRVATPGAFYLTVSDPVSGVNHLIPPNCNGFVQYRCVGGAWRIMASGQLTPVETGWAADTEVVSKAALAAFTQTAGAAYNQTAQQDLIDAVIELRKQVVALKAQLRRAGVIAS